MGKFWRPNEEKLYIILRTHICLIPPHAEPYKNFVGNRCQACFAKFFRRLLHADELLMMHNVTFRCQVVLQQSRAWNSNGGSVFRRSYVVRYWTEIKFDEQLRPKSGRLD